MKNRNIKAHFRVLYGLIKNNIGINTPISVQIKSTYKCNMKCDFCNVWQERLKEADTGSFRKIIADSYSLGAGIINFSGGEPLLRKDIIELISYSKKTGFITMMNTNGYLLPGYSQKLSGVLDFISVSIDFPDAKKHDSFRGLKGAFSNALEGIEKSQKAGISVKIHCTVTSKNIDMLEDMVMLSKKMNTKITFTPVMIEFAPSGKLLNKALPKLSKLEVSPKLYASKVLELKKKYKEVITPDYFIKAVRSGNVRCNASSTLINVQPDGTFVLPCEVFPLKKMSALDLKYNYNSTELKAMLKNNGKFAFCRKCYSQCSLTPILLMNPFNSLEMFFRWRF
jgi:MoaA/NifB/PqqE/SkfB family radical SAM enzyme